MAEVRPERAARSRRGQRRPPTWEVSDSEAEGDGSAEAGARAPGVAGERRAAAWRPELALQRLVVRVDPAVLEDTGADVLMEALGALGCECRIEPQRRARSLRWSGVRHDPGSVAPEVWATEEQELLLLLLLEPEEFLQGTAQLTQQALMACSTEQERLGLLADLPVEASKGRQSRRVGPDLSRRICLFLTTTSPDLLLDLGS